MGTRVNYEKQKKKTKIEPHYPSDFRPIGTHPLAPHFFPVLDISLSEADLVHANLEVGYGRWEKLADMSILSSSQVRELHDHIKKRGDWLFSGLDFKHGCISLKGFKSITETSDQATESYYFGMIFGYIALRCWLPPGSEIRRVLHVSIYSKGALIKIGNQVRFDQVGEKSPDLLCQDSSGQWHFVEAKGGEKKYRLAAVNKALEQLDGISNIRDHASGLAEEEPRSCICAFVQTYSNYALDDPDWKLWVIDPEPSKKVTLLINADIAELRLVVAQDTLIRHMHWSNRRPLADAVRFKKTALKAVLIRPMLADRESDFRRAVLARLETLADIVMDDGDSSMQDSLEMTDEVLSSELRRELSLAEKNQVVTRLSDYPLWMAEENRTIRKAHLIDLLFEVLGLRAMLDELRRQREAFYNSTREQLIREQSGNVVAVRQLTSGAIVVGFSK